MNLLVTWLLMTMTVVLNDGAEELAVLENPPGETAADELLHAKLQHDCFAALERRRARYEELKTEADCHAYQQRMREFFIRQLGGFPERTPLNAAVVGRLPGDGFRVEKVLFESQPNHHVTGLLYLPETEPPYPGVLVPCGHSHNGKAADGYQRIAMLLARNGMAALCYDPIGQGERAQILWDEPRNQFYGYERLQPPHPRVQFLCTTEHTLVDVGAILVGSNSARYRIWDGMRAIDYLISRDDIDPARIGCTGISGGGTLTSYLMALDDRIACAAPGCYLTTFRKLLESAGPQDGEQNIFGQISYGMDAAEYVLMRAPKPTLILAGTQDRTFDVVGTWDVFRDAKRFYSRMGFSERVELAEPDVPHGFPKPLREASARWMRRWLLDQNDAVTEPEFETFADQQLRCSPQGQVMLMPGQRSVIDLNTAWEEELAKDRSELWARSDEDEIRDKIRQTAGVRPLQHLAKVGVRNGEKISRNGYTIQKLVLQPEHRVPLPALLFEPSAESDHIGDRKAYLYVHGEGKHVDAGIDGPIEQLVRQGSRVLALDVRGIGETRRKDNPRLRWTAGMFGTDYHEFMLAYLNGKSFVGMRSEDVLVAARFLAESRDSASPSPVHLVGIGKAAIAALHAAALEGDSFGSVRLERMLPSWVDLLQAKRPHDQLVNTVHAALRVYDLPDLVRLAGKDKVELLCPASPELADSPELAQPSP